MPPQQPGYGYPQQAPQPPQAPQGFPAQQGFAPQQPFPGQPNYAYPPGFAPKPGNPVGGFFLGLLVSFVVAGLYTLIWYATYKDMNSEGAIRGLYYGHALINGALTGLVVGMVAGRSNGAAVGAAIISALGAFFGFTNGYTAIMLDTGGEYFLRDNPMFPAEVWWATEAGDHLLAVLGVLLAAGAAWGLAFAMGRRRRS
ncbi:hypothetical protein P8605_13110 [Streptomyces sp. T-3]|nr:hypothetical protein [Streptomyces sp. T-3]